MKNENQNNQNIDAEKLLQLVVEKCTNNPQACIELVSFFSSRVLELYKSKNQLEDEFKKTSKLRVFTYRKLKKAIEKVKVELDVFSYGQALFSNAFLEPNFNKEVNNQCS